MKPVSKARWPWMTIGLVALQVFVFSLEKRAMRWRFIDLLMHDYALSGANIAVNFWGELPRFISHTFLHANESHLIGNMVFFLLFAPAVERTVGSLTFLVCYFVWGIAAALTQVFFSPFTAQLIGASGAISGAAGAFFVLFPLRMPVTFLNPLVGKAVSKVPAFFFIGLWFLGQLHDGFRALMPDPLSSQLARVATWAHVGGFAAGAISIVPYIFFKKSGGGNVEEGKTN